jgi:hypothetical protein
MRYVSKILVVAVSLVAIGTVTSRVRANDLQSGTFKLRQPTLWNNTMLPAGDYKFQLLRTQSDARLLSVRGAKQSLTLYLFANSACDSCRTTSLNISVQDGRRVVTSLELPGFHADFSTRTSLVETSQPSDQADHAPASSEQISVHVKPN